MSLYKLASVCGVCVLLCAGRASAVNVVIDYTYDTGNFFGAGNPSGATAGQQARDALEAAAQFFSDITNDTFSEISTPAPYDSQFFSGHVEWEWSLDFTHPTLNTNVELFDQTIPADEYRIYAGARSIPGTTLGIGGPGGWGWSSTPSGGFTQSEIDELNQITDDFADAVENRGEASGFSNWGGAITFDTTAGWHYDHTSQPGAFDDDFFSVALHELSHALGFGASSEWSSLVSGSFFTGSASYTENSNTNPSLYIDSAHWAEDTMSTVYGGTAVQEAAMDPNITNGDRKLITALDAAGLTDIGWDLTPPVIGLTGDLNGDGYVGLDDLDIVLNNWNLNVPPGDSRADPSGDGFVGLDDLDTVLNNWNAGTPPAGSAVPEPVGLTMACLALPALLGRRA